MRAWYLVVSSSPDATRRVVARFGAALGEPTSRWNLGRSVELADYVPMGTPPRGQMSGEHLDLFDGAGEGSGEVLNTVAVHGEDRPRVEIRTDATGLFPAYYAQDGETFVASSHLNALAAALGLSLDPVGELEFFGLGYAVGPRTLYQGASNLRPCSSLVYDGDVHIGPRRDVAPLYVDAPSKVGRRDAPEAIWESLRASCRKLGDATDGPVGVFLSGGLDSRMLMAGLAAEEVPMVAATHGQAHLQEIKVAARVAELADTPLTISELGPLSLLGTQEELTDLFLRADHLLFPWWRHTSQALVGAGARTAATGYMLDATLGGHFHDEGVKKDRFKRRLQNAVRAPSASGAAFLETDAYLTAFVAKQLATVRGNLRFRRRMLSTDSALWNPHLLDAAEADIEDELSHYRATGTGTPARLKERFLVENRARKYAFTQELISRRWLGLGVPMAEVGFLELLASLPSHWLLDHHLYFQVLRTHARPYAAIPGSNSPLPVLAPTPALEVGRLVRNRYDRLAMRTALKSKGQRRLARYGSVDYEDVARRPGADQGVRAILAKAPSSNLAPDGGAKLLDDVASFKRFSFNMVPITTLATLHLAANVADVTADRPLIPGGAT